MNSSSAELKPFKAIVLGPPASGKTTLAERLCQYYGAHYVTVKTMIDETLGELNDNIEREIAIEKARKLTKEESKPTKEDVGEQSESEDSDEDPMTMDEDDEYMIRDVEVWQEQVRDIMSAMNKGENGRLPDDYVIRLMRSFLSKELCQTRGYVLDGFPKTMQQAIELFGQATEVFQKPEELPRGEPGEGEEANIDQVGKTIGNASQKLLPSFVISLEAHEAFLCERVMRLPQSEVKARHYDEATMIKKLAEYKTNNTYANTVLRFFDDVGIHPILINVEDETTGQSRDFHEILDYLYELIGKPIPGFGITLEDEEKIRQLEKEKWRLEEEQYKIEKQLQDAQTIKEHQEKMEKWAETFEKLQKEEEKLLVAQSEPLRFYLMKYIFPTLCKGLCEVAKIKPDDPIDFLAEYLFKENPEGKMFDPSYTRDGKEILDTFDEETKSLEIEE